MENRTLAVIGGTFNPFTNAHREMALYVRRLFPKVDIVYVPSNLNFMAGWKDLPCEMAFSGENRVDLIEKSITDIPRCTVTDIECTGKVSGRTYETVQYFKRDYETVYVCMGSDKLHEIEKWYHATELMKEVTILLFTRGELVKNCNSEFVKRYRDKIVEIEFNHPDISSSLVRDLYKQEKFVELKKYVPDPVYEYLRKVR